MVNEHQRLKDSYVLFGTILYSEFEIAEKEKGV